jgi:hypothetical protein
MIPHDVLMAAKIGMIESVVKDLLAHRFLEEANPLQSLEEYAANRVKKDPPHPSEADLHLVYETVWGEFFDNLKYRIEQGLSRRTL